MAKGRSLLRTMMIGFLGLVLLVALLAGIGVFLLYHKGDEWLRSGTEKGLTYVLQVDCKVASAKVEVMKGAVSFEGIVIPNPEGYKGAHSMKFGKVAVEADIKSFKTDEPVIRLIQISGADFQLEQTLKGSNFQDLIKNAQRLSTGEEEPEEESSKAMRIDKIVVDGTTAGVVVPMSGGKALSVPLPKIEMTDIGGKKEKVTPAEALTEFLNTVLATVVKAGESILPTEALKDLGGSVVKAGGEAVSGAADVAKGAAKEVGGAVSGVAKGIGGILGGGEKKEGEKD